MIGTPYQVAIIGGGYTGALLAMALAHKADVTIIDPNQEPGRGVAYAKSDSHLLINVPASRMRPFPDQPNDFADWAAAHDHPEAFPPRELFGRYIATRLGEHTHTHLRARAHAITRDNNRLAITTDTTIIKADAIILALGNPPPRPLMTLLRLAIDDTEPGSDVPKQAPLLIVGTGLTMADVVAGLIARGHTGPITAVSRRGLLPHIAGQPPPARPGIFATPPRTAVALFREVRHEAALAEREVGDWRRTIDEFRFALPAIWQTMPDAERDRLERHAGAAWNIHRYRMPPAVHHTVHAAIGTGQLTILAGRLMSFDNGHATIATRQGPVVRPAISAINCTGPDYAFRSQPNRLLNSLFSAGLAVRGARDNGLLLDEEDRVIGNAPAAIYAAGPTARARYGELTAASEIGHQTIRVAAAIERLFTSGRPPHPSPKAAATRPDPAAENATTPTPRTPTRSLP